MEVLDKGFVNIVDYLGSDLTIANAARVSYGKRKDMLDAKDVKLINFLAKHKHMSPFRHNYIQFHIKAPEFIMRQWYKHVVGCEWTSGDQRITDHGFNEISGRYAELPLEFYIPSTFRPQSKVNKQASADGDLSNTLIDENIFKTVKRITIQELYNKFIFFAGSVYKIMLKYGVAREMARMVIPLSFYTEVYWTASLQAVANFVKLRDHEGAQWEIQEYARAIDRMMESLYPTAWKALKENL